jgi:hypothetical protein
MFKTKCVACVSLLSRVDFQVQENVSWVIVMLSPSTLKWLSTVKPIKRTLSNNSKAREERLIANARRIRAQLAARNKLKRDRAIVRWKNTVNSIRTAQRALRKNKVVSGHGSRSKIGLTNKELRALEAYKFLSKPTILKRTNNRVYRTFG